MSWDDSEEEDWEAQADNPTPAPVEETATGGAWDDEEDEADREIAEAKARAIAPKTKATKSSNTKKKLSKRQLLKQREEQEKKDRERRRQNSARWASKTPEELAEYEKLQRLEQERQEDLAAADLFGFEVPPELKESVLMGVSEQEQKNAVPLEVVREVEAKLDSKEDYEAFARKTATKLCEKKNKHHVVAALKVLLNACNGAMELEQLNILKSQIATLVSAKAKERQNSKKKKKGKGGAITSNVRMGRADENYDDYDDFEF